MNANLKSLLRLEKTMASQTEDVSCPTKEIRAPDHLPCSEQEDLHVFVEPLHEKLKLFEEVKEKCVRTADHIRIQTQQAEGKIREQFEKLRQFLQEEEEARISALREEEEQKIKEMEEKIEVLTGDIKVMLDTIRAAEELRSEDVSFQLKRKASVERALQRPLPVDQLVSGALLDVAKHLGNLGFNIWKKLKEIVCYTPVILDPNTAHLGVVLSADLTSATLGKTGNLPENPERITVCHSVLGSEGFDCGTHSWEVHVGRNKGWKLGVLAESAKSQGEPEYLGLAFYDGAFAAFSQSSITALEEKPKLQRIQICLDWDKGTISFFNPDSNLHIHTITHTFTDRLFPFINTWDIHTLKILPQQVTIHV